MTLHPLPTEENKDIDESLFGRLDKATMLPTRSFLVEMLEIFLGDSHLRSGELSIVLININRFNCVVDHLSPRICDELLYQVGQRIRTFVNAAIAVTRFCSEGFGILLHCETQTNSSMEHLLGLLRKAYLVDGQDVVISLSMGIANSSATLDNVADLLHAAVLAVHQAEYKGGSAIQVFNPVMQERSRYRKLLERELRTAVGTLATGCDNEHAHSGLAVHYQPQVTFAEGSITGFEALIRWKHPTRGNISPADFIPLAEELDLIDVLEPVS